MVKAASAPVSGNKGGSYLSECSHNADHCAQMLTRVAGRVWQRSDMLCSLVERAHYVPLVCSDADLISLIGSWCLVTIRTHEMHLPDPYVAVQPCSPQAVSSSG